MTPTSDEVSRAIVVWTGYDPGVELGKPDRDEARLVEAFGETAILDLLPIVNGLQQDFYTSTAYNTVAGSREMAEQAANEFRGRHPELSGDAVAALAWCYSFDWK
ncbi:MAG: hypothetical protein WCC60_07225 [Ilumatobacteraceae bacterium]